MKALNAWIKAHPYKALLFVFLFTVISSAMAVVNTVGFWCGLGIYALLGLAWSMVFSRDVSIILALSLAAGSIEATEPPVEAAGGIAVGVVVICVGGYCVYKTVKFCQRKFPKETNGGTNSFIPVADGESAASWNYGAIGSCDPTLTPGPDLLAQETGGTLFTIDILIDQEGNATVSTSAIGEAATQSWIEFQAEIARHGIQITGNPDNSQYFSTNRVPCAPADVAISFDATTKTVDLKDSGGPVNVIEVDRSRDLQNWTPFLRTRVGAGGRGLRIEDATTTSTMFYRVNVSRKEENQTQ